MVTIKIVINSTRVMGILGDNILPVLHCLRGEAFVSNLFIYFIIHETNSLHNVYKNSSQQRMRLAHRQLQGGTMTQRRKRYNCIDDDRQFKTAKRLQGLLVAF